MSPSFVDPTKIHANWAKRANDEEIQRLNTLYERKVRKYQTIAEIEDEERTIMRRCIARDRRAKGLQK